MPAVWEAALSKPDFGMKHKLNLNEPGSRLLGIALILLAISVSLFGFAWILGRFVGQAAWMKDLAWYRQFWD